MVDVDIVTLQTMDSFDSSAFESALLAALTTVVSDGEIGDYKVDTSGSVDIGTPSIGTHITMLAYCI